MMILIAILCWVFVCFLFLEDKLGFHNIALTISLSFLISISITSYSFFAALFSHTPFHLFQGLWLGIPLLILAINWQKVYTRIAAIRRSSFPTLNTYSTLGLICLLIYSWLFWTTVQRWGGFDAVAIWTAHAKFLIFDHAFNNLFETLGGHPYYPLMLPSIITCIWKSMGNMSPMVPVFVAYTTSMALIVMIWTALISHGKRTLGLIGLVMLTCTDMVYPFGASQGADTMVATFIVVPLILLSFLPQQKPQYCLILVGFLVASCGWVKDEGIAYFLIFAALFIWQNRKKHNFILYFLIGAAIPLMTIMIFKVFYAPESTVLSKPLASKIEKIADVDRYITILRLCLSTLFTKFPLLVLLLAAVVVTNYKQIMTFNFLVLFVLLFVFLGVYLITPYPLEWHIRTSFSRLLHQLTPAFFFSFLLLFNEKRLQGHIGAK